MKSVAILGGAGEGHWSVGIRAWLLSSSRGGGCCREHIVPVIYLGCNGGDVPGTA
jgi:hypothetical protein